MRDIIMSSILTALFVLVVSFLYNEVDAKIYCAPEKIEDIQALDINDRLPQLMSEVKPLYKFVGKDFYDRPQCEMQIIDEGLPSETSVAINEPCCMDAPCSQNAYYIEEPTSEADTRTLYERVVIDVKPTEAELQAPLDAWKADKISDINYELSVCEMQQDFRQLAKKCGYERSNITKLMHEMIDSKDLVKRDCMVSKQAELSSEKERDARIAAKKKLGALAKQVSEEVYDLIAGYNVDRSLTQAQINEMESTFAPVMQALQAKRPKKAKGLIQSIQPDGTLITQQMKDDVLHLLKDL